MLLDLAQMPVAEALRRLSLEGKSGDLEVRSGEVIKTVFFDHGRVVFAASNQSGDRLGESLLALGRIDYDEFQHASALVEQGHRRRFGEALVEAGVLDENEVGRSVARQVNKIVISLFRFAEGVATFEERRCTIPLDYMVSLSLPRLLYEGIKTMRNPELVLAGIGDLDRRVTVATLPPFRFDSSSVSAMEEEMLEQAKRKVTLRRLAWHDGDLDARRVRASYALLAAGILVDAEQVRQASATRAPIQVETGTFLLSALRRRPQPTVPEAIGQEIEEELRRSAELDREDWLRVAHSAPREEVLRALDDKMKRYYELHQNVGSDAQLRTAVELILGRAAAARHSVETAGTPLPLPPAADEVAGEITAKHKLPEETPLDRLRREGDVRMKVGDAASAVRVFTELVAQAPEEAEDRLRLALAMAAYPLTAHDAEREFHEAVRLAPHSRDIHYRFGLYYKAMKQKARAVAELETVLRLDPRHYDARRELEAVSPEDADRLRRARR